MNYDEKLIRSAVLGAAGKMGSGITLLLASEMADISLKPENKDNVFKLYAIDISDSALKGLQSYLRAQLLRIAEKKAVGLRETYKDRSDLVENKDIINQYVEDALGLIQFSTRTEVAYDAKLVFEAAVEEVELKVNLLRQIDEQSSETPWYLTNTSSIPIAELNEKCALNGRIVGFHFYNPPAVQRILEFVAPEGTNRELVDFSLKLAQNMKKVVVQANDFAGFIGNGYLMRDILNGIEEASALADEIGYAKAVYAINKITNEFLLRPMGIFQLMDYVGIDVCQKIMKVMAERLEKPELHSPIIDAIMNQGVSGGQYSDGSQKPGIFQYEKGKISAVYDFEKKAYIPVNEIRDEADRLLGQLPEHHQPWKSIIRNPEKNIILDKYFKEMRKMESKGAKLAADYLEHTKTIGVGLVEDGIARSIEDVNTVMITGFYHAYGIINEY